MTTDSTVPIPTAAPRTVRLGVLVGGLCVAIVITALTAFGYFQWRYTVFLQDAFCGFVQPVAAAGNPPNPPPATPTGVAIIKGANGTTMKLRCPPYVPPAP